MIIKRIIWLSIILIMFVGIGFYWYGLNQEDSTKTLSPFVKTIDECDWIAEKSAMELPEALPFQKLEKLARRIRVFETCMQDRGLKENPAWVAYAEPLAKQQAKQQGVSVSEAYESIRRKGMLQDQPFNHAPQYWLLIEAQGQRK